MNTIHQRWISGVVISGIGLVTALCHLDHLLEDLNGMPIISSIVFPLLLSVALFGAGYWLAQSTYTGEQVVRVAIWSIIGGIILTLLGIAIAVYQHTVATSDSRTAFVIIPSSVTEGTAIGFIFGIYTI